VINDLLVSKISSPASSNQPDTRQLVINTGTIVTFLMVFLIQKAQNRDAGALRLKLDELLRSLKAARNRPIDLENCSDEEVDQIERQFQAVKRQGKRQDANGARGGRG
jgi:low affinity Fe/Cu permease